MGLIDSPRLSAADRAHWARLASLDALLAMDPRLDVMANRARQVIRDFAAAGPCIASTSWGKDSTVMADLVATSGANIPIVWWRTRHFEMPESDLVRDAFLAKHPQVRYEERETVWRWPKRGEPGFEERESAKNGNHSRFINPMKERYITGVRGQESRMRTMVMHHFGESSRNSSRPIGWWDATHVFAWLHREDLPVHTAYAASVGGQMDRQWLRVHALCTAPPPTSSVHGWDMAGWEDRYWGDVIEDARAARAHMWTRGPLK